jgi:dermatan 4-sulfotransferase 1
MQSLPVLSAFSVPHRRLRQSSAKPEHTLRPRAAVFGVVAAVVLAVCAVRRNAARTSPGAAAGVPLGTSVLASWGKRRARTRADSAPPYGGLAARRVVVSNVTTLTGAQILSRPFSKRVIVSETSKLIFCPIPKAACSNWKYLIRKLEGLDDYYDLSKAHDPDVSGLRYLSDYSPNEVDTLLSDATFFKFTFVRDPYVRAVSCYMDKFQNRPRSARMSEAYLRAEYRTFLGQLFDWRYARSVDVDDPSERPSFADFVDELAKQDPTAMNEHWMPQTLLCGFGDMPYDFVGSMENLSADAAYVLRKIGRPGELFPTREDIDFPASSNQSTDIVADDIYTLETMLKVRVIYDVDFNSNLGATLPRVGTPLAFG